jgi:alkaline phosphatase D
LQAYYEHMPLEQPPSFNGIDAHLQVYGKYRLGPVDLLLTDTRQYRSDQPCGPGFPAEPYCEQLQDPSLTMTGKAQERWLLDGIRRANARYTVIATQTWFAPYRYNAAPESPAVNTDQWDGYPLQRQRLIDALAAAPGTPVVLGGDWHCAAAMRIHKDPWDERSARVGHNLCGTSISSSCPWWERLSAARDHNPHVDHVDGANRGYLLMQVGPQGWETDFRVVEDPRLAESAVRSSLKLKLSDT